MELMLEWGGEWGVVHFMFETLCAVMEKDDLL